MLRRMSSRDANKNEQKSDANESEQSDLRILVPDCKSCEAACNLGRLYQNEGWDRLPASWPPGEPVIRCYAANAAHRGCDQREAFEMTWLIA